MSSMRSTLMRWAYRAAQVQWRLTRPLIVGVRVLMVQDGAVVLVRHTYQDLWYLPGGSVKRFEMPADAARREVAEEVDGVINGELRLFGVYVNFVEHKSDHIVTFMCEAFELGAGRDRWEIEAVGLFDITALPPDISPATSRRIEEYRSGMGPFSGKW